MSAEQLQQQSHQATPRFSGIDLAGLQGDGTARAGDDGRRRALACPPWPAGATPQVSVAAWHGVLHWLRYNDEPVTTCLVGARARACWPIVTSVGGETTMAQLLAEVSAQWLPPADQWLDLADPAHADLIDPLRSHAIRIEAGKDEVAPEFALILDGGAWRVSCAASRYSEPYQQFLMALWRQFVATMVDEPHALLARQTCNGAAMSGPVVSIAGDLVGRFKAWVADTPGKTAVIDDQGSISFAELDALSSSWARALREAGVRRGDYVGVVFGRDRMMVAAQLAVLKAGAAFVPMDATQPQARLQAMAEDTDMRLALTSAGNIGVLAQALPGVQCLVTDQLPAGEGGDAMPLGTDDLAYVIFTSGSTGRPKGVKVSHGNLLNFVAHLNEWVGAQDVMSQFAPVTFDASVAEIHTAILNGATLVILSSELIEDPDRLQAYMNEQGVSFAAFPPQYAQHLSPERLPRLKTLLTAGSAPDHALIKRWQPHVRYINAYGPTETTILSTAWQASRTPGVNEPIVIGTPICNTEVRVVNRFNQSLPHGVIGELLIGGEGVTHGYIKRDALTRERFITMDQTRWYRSGDLSCFDGEGQLIFAGRVDSQIKLRGHRLEPGEVEAALMGIDGMRQAAALAVDVAGAKQLVVFCAGVPLPEAALREQLGHLLPAWAQPNRIVWLADLPLTPNGKTDYAALASRLADDRQADAPAAPMDHADELEAQIAQIWASVLQQPHIGRDAHFIHLGGDSLTSLVVTSAVRRLGYQPTSAQLLQHPRLADYAAIVRAGGRQAIDTEQAICQGEAPLTPIQAWFFSLNLAHPGTFCQSLVFEAEGRIDVERLKQACARLVAHHDQLRARFVPDATAVTGWRQDILPEDMALPELHVLDLADSLLDATSEAYGQRLAAELHLDAAPLFRLAVIHTPRRSRVVWVLHHLIVDTVSHGILLDDLHQLYQGTQALPSKSVAYGTWAARLRDQVAGRSRELLAQWQAVIAAVTRADPLPVRREGPSGGLAVSKQKLSRELTGRLLRQAGHAYRQSPEELVLAATYLALGRTLGVRRVAIDVEWHGREETLAGPRGIDRTVGWFTSVHPLAMPVPAGADLGLWLMALKETRAAIPQRGLDFYSLRYLGDDAGVQAEFARCPRPDVLFNFSGVVQRTHATWHSVPVAAIELGEGNASPYPLSIESEVRDGELIVGLYHDPAAWAQGRIERLGEAILACLGEVIDHAGDAAHRRWTPSDFPQLQLTQAQADSLPTPTTQAFGLTDMQQAMLRHQGTYQVQMCHRMPRDWHEAAWRQAANDWVRRHDCLRTVIQEWDDGQAAQVVLERLPLPLNVHRAGQGQGEAMIQALLDQHRGRAVRLDQAPLFSLDIVHEDQAGSGFLVLLGIHHIIHDGWTIELLLGDLLQTYRHHLGEAVPVPAAPLAGMSDVVARQRQLGASEAWRAHFAGLPWAATACQLPATSTRQAPALEAASPDTRLYLGHLAPSLVESVREAARTRGVTINSLWLAGYVGLLRYLGGQAQVRCGVIQNGRMEDIAGVETVTGCCVNTLPLVVDVPATATFGVIAREVGEQLEHMRAAAAFPLSIIHDAVKPLIEDEIFSTLFNVESRRYGSAQDLRPDFVTGHESTNYAFIFGLLEREAPGQDGTVGLAYDLRIGYDARRHDEATISTWLGIYARCMQALVDTPDEPWRGLSLLPEALQRQAVGTWNDTRRDYPSDRCVHELFREQALRHPARPALRHKDAVLTYAELDQRTDALALVLRARGAGPGQVVGLVAERSPEMVMAILAVFKAGASYVPIDPRYPADRVRHMVGDVACQLAIFQRGDLSSVIPGDLAVDRLYLDQPLADVDDADRTKPSPAPSSRDLAYVMYTSGSTGQPKGVMIEHRSIVRLVANSADFSFAPDDCILLTSAPGFDVTTWEVWSALLNGLPLAIVDEATLLSPDALAAEMRAKGVTTLWLIAPLFNQLVQERPDLFQGVRQLMIGGDALSAPHVQMARRANPGLRIINGYGPTENTSFSTYHFVSDADQAVVPIGRPITNSTAYVVNAEGQLLPPGVPGELLVGGPGVARGYLNQPELTAAKFVPDPYSDEQGACLYRTGDLVRWREDGLIDFLGRIDHQVKIRGFRIELGEIEAAIARREDVKQAIVLVRQNAQQKQLVAYLVAKHPAGLDKAALAASVAQDLRTALPDYMVPAAFVLLDAMPRNANGKIDRARLPEPDASAYALGTYAEPGNGVERTLWAIWREVLGTDAFGVTDGFYTIGGDSILAIQVVAKAGRQGLALTPRLIVEAQTIRQIAEKITPPAGKAPDTPQPGQAQAGTPPALVAATDRPVQGQQRLLPIQHQFLQDPVDVDQYAQYMLVALPDGTTRESLATALAAVVARHDVLRLKFRDTPSGWVAVYRPEMLVPTPEMLGDFIDVIDGDEAQADAAGQVAAMLTQLDIRQGLLFKCRLLGQGREKRLLWAVHHLVVDAVSWHVLSADLSAALAAVHSHVATTLDAKPDSYQAWAARLHDHAYSPELEEERVHWLHQLTQPSARLPVAETVEGQGAQPLEGTTLTMDIGLDAAQTRQLQAAHARHGTQMQHLLVTALGRALGHWLGADAIRIDLEGHGRDGLHGVDLFQDLDASRTVGWFTTLYPVHLSELRADMGSQIRRTQASLAAVPHKGIGFGLLSQLAQDEALAAAGPATSEVLFNYLGQFDAGMTGGAQVSPRRQRTHALRIVGMVRDGALSLRLDHSPEQLGQDTVAALAQHLQAALHDLIAHDATAQEAPASPPAFDLSGLSTDEVEALKARHPALVDIYPCTGMQQGLLVQGARAPHSGVYLTQLRMKLEGADPARLRQSWQTLADRHEALRSAFADAGGEGLVQLVCAQVDLPWREVDARALPGGASTLDALLDEERTRPFDTTQAPLSRLLLVRTSDQGHCLAWTHHHALLDGWSIGLLVKELFEVYSGSEPARATRPSWREQVQWLRSHDRSAAERYWQGYFDGLDMGASASLPIAPGRAGQAGPTDPSQTGQHEQAVATLDLPPDTTAQLLRLARSEGMGLGTLMFAAWGLLLSKYSAEPEVLFGYASSGRSPQLAGSDALVGLCINSLPLRLKIDGEQTLGAWLKAIQRQQLDHDDHGHLALADIQRCGGVRTGHALFDSLVVVENYPLDRSLLSSAKTDKLPRIVSIEGVEQNDFALNLAVYPGERLGFKLAWRTALFEPGTAQAMLDRLAHLLEGFTRGGAQTLSQLSILSQAEIDRVLGPWNDTALPYPADQSVPDLFEAIARRRNTAPALAFGDQTWSYERLDGQVRLLSAWLAGQGVVPGSRVALSLHRSPDMVAAMLALMRLGAAYVPIAIDCPAERRAFLLADAGIGLTLTQRSALGALNDERMLVIEDCPDPLPPAERPQVDPQATAYIIYTSGTTGTPKGVAVSHRNLVNFCAWGARDGLWREGEAATQFAPFTFDASVGEVFGALLAGGHLHLLADALIQEPRALAAYLNEHDIRFAAFPPSYLQQMDPQAVPPRLTLLTAGSAPTPELVKRWSERCRYINAYGPTETTILSSAWIAERGQAEGGALSIGQPIANTVMYVVDRLGQLCPPSLVGEIWIGGDGVAQGYLNRPELNERHFVPDPWRPGHRLYRTGDLGRWLDDGCIQFVGRRDRQVKLRGYRIELNEVESRIRAHAQVEDAAVLVRGQDGDQRLLAWVVPKGPFDAVDHESLDASIRDFMRQALPEYMLPQAIVPLPQLPLTHNGKIDDKALPEPSDLASSPGAQYLAPRTPTEARLAVIWAEVLKLRPEQVGANADFFALGGHSLLAMRVAARVRDELRADVDVGELFNRPVLADLAQAVDQAARSTLPPIVPVPRGVPLPLSHAQQRLWFIDQMEDDGSAYTVPGVLRLEGRLDRVALRRALDRIVARHEALRTSFVAVAGQPRQQIHEATSFHIDEHDLRGLDWAGEHLACLLQEEVDTPFDLGTGPLIRGNLIQLDDDTHVLQFTMHHIVTDGWALFLKELGTLYNAYKAGLADPLPPLTVQYADYAAWQQQWFAGDVWQAQSDYWRQALAGAPALLELPSDRPRPAQQDYAGGLAEVAFDADLTARLKALGRRHGTTLYMTLLAAWSVVLSKLSGQQDLVIGSPVANRGQVETEPLIGFFVNPLALRLDLSGNPTLAELLSRVRRQVLDGQRHQQLPFEQVVEIVQPPRSLAHTPVFQMMFNWQDLSLDGVQMDGIQFTPMRPPRTVSKYDLTLDLGQNGEGIAGGFEYASALFDADTIGRQAGYLRQVLEAMVADAGQAVGAVDLLGEHEHRLLRSFNDTAKPELHAHPWPELFESQALRTPSRIAARCGEASLTYGALNDRATRFAKALAAQGAGPGQVVALLDKRGIDLLVMIVAVLKSGAAYMPLDPSHPSQRWLEVLEDAEPVLLLVGEGLATEQRWLRRKWTGGEVIGLSDLQAAEAIDRALPRATLDDLAYVLFTSGSTGKPKGVMIEHRGMVNNMRAKVEPLGLGVDDVIAQTASQCFDISVWQFLTALLLGGEVLILGDELTRDPEALLDHLALHRATIWEPVPSVMQAALPWRKPLPSLRWVLPTGEALSRELVARWFEQYPDIPLMNAYGPAECSDDVAFQPIRGPVARVLIGQAVANAQLHVVDEQLMLLPLGAVGELAVSGPVVGRGYLNRPEETRAAFRPNPRAQGETDRRLYLTGDLARRWPDGSLEFVGRKDFQVKIRGFRIELGEIESCLASHAAVREAVVSAREQAPGQGDAQLVAYVTLRQPVEQEALRAHLRAHLPAYMLPAAIVVLPALPLNANGKVDRKALPAPEVEAFTQRAFEAPVGPIEQRLAELWAELLKLDQVGRHDNFFELGGHSLLAVTLIERLRRQGLKIEVRSLYERPSLMALAEAVSVGAAQAPAEFVVPPNGIPEGCTHITPEMLRPLLDLNQAHIDQVAAQVPGGAANIQDIYPLAPLQEGFLFHHLIKQQGDVYLVAALFTFDSRERLDGFAQTLNQVIARHDILRTAVLWEGLSEPVQVVWREARFEIDFPDLGQDMADGVSIEARLLERTDPRHHPLDIRQAPMMHGFAAFDPARGCWLLQFVYHHIVADHTTLERMIKEIWLIQAGRETELVPSLPFRNYVAQARLAVSPSAYEAFFKEMLGDIDEPTAPFGLLSVQGDGSQVQEARMMLDRSLVERIRQQARVHGVSAASLFHLAFAQVLAKSTGRQDVVFGTVLFGRMQGGEGADQVMGMFINTLPLRVSLGDVPVAQSLQATHAKLIGLLEREHAPLELAQRCSAVPAAMPLFSALLNYRHSPKDVGDLRLEGMALLGAADRTNYLFDFSVDDMGDDIQLVGQVDASVGAWRACEHLQAAVTQLVTALEQSPDTPIGLLDTLPEAERTQVLRGWNATERAWPLDRCIHELFEDQAERTPDAWAVLAGEKRLSYRDLNARANQLAHHLRSLGVRPDTRVALCVERGEAMLTALLAVFKAGGAYVPLDPSYPPDRIGHMLTDSSPTVVLSHGRARTLVARQLMTSPDASLLAVPLIDLETDRHLWAGLPTHNPDPREVGLNSRHLAYVIYTSGSTGKPKGVMIEHRGLVNYTLEAIGWFGLSAQDIVLQQNSLNFDLSLEEALPALLCGAALAPSNELFGLDTQAGPPPTFVHLTAAHWQTLVGEWADNGDKARRQLAGVRMVNVTGDALSAQKLAQWDAVRPAGTRLINTYGPTEITISCSAAYVQHTPGLNRVSIGTPFANTQVYILDAHRLPVPIGVAGEMHIGGVGVARGYLKLDQLTAERFLADPFSSEPGARMYKTGDLARWLPNGEVEFIGRNDFQAKVRGFRIELGEVEGHLARSPGVQEVAVIVRSEASSGSEDKRLVAYYTGPALPESLRAHAVAGLPDYMVPSAFVPLPRLPLTPNGKLDREALPAPTAAALAQGDHDAPVTDTEKAIAQLWEELLHVPRVSRGDSYFDLGGSSLQMIRMLGRLKDQGFALGLTDMFQLRTVSACAAAIDAQRAGGARWPLDGERWRHALVRVGEGASSRQALLLHSSESARRPELQGLLDAVPAAERPHFVRYADDIDVLSSQIRQAGVAALAPARSEALRLEALRTQLQACQSHLAVARQHTTTMRLSPIQSNLLAWEQRDGLAVIELDGWYSAAELQQAFATVAAEQDMLRAALDAQTPQWHLLPADKVAAAMPPAVDLRGEDPASIARLLKGIGEALMAARANAPLAYVAAIASLSDLEHRLILAIDHLAWDGMSATVLQRRLQERLRGVSKCLQRHYRDYAEAAWQLPGDSTLAPLREAADLPALSTAMARTRQALAGRTHLPLQAVAFRLPGNDDGRDAAELAFETFKRCVAHLTGLERYGVVLNHHGREAGAERWFDQVGLFLDKVPFAAGADTPWPQLADRAALCQKQGINHVALAQASSFEWGGTLPHIDDEVQFNFQSGTPSSPDPAEQERMMSSLQNFRGILFETVADEQGQVAHCVFRGEAADAQAIQRIAAGQDPHTEPPEPTAPAGQPARRPTAEPAYSLEVRDVRKHYGDFEAVKGVSFSVRKGGCFGILGPNGAGKTSLLAMIEGIVPITSGSISVLGMDVGTQIDRIQPHVGVQLQQNNYFEFLTVAQLLKFYQELRSSMGGNKRRGRSVASLLERLELQDKLDFKVDELSGGQKQRLSIAIALLEDPDVIFLDEPTSALDPHSRIATWEFIEDLKKDPSKTVILTTHYMEEAERLCDEILLMDRGKIIAQGIPSDLVHALGAQHAIQVQFGRSQFKPELLHQLTDAQGAEWNDKTDCLRLRTRRVTDTLREVLAMSQTACIDVVNFDISRPTLEDVFLSHTNKELQP